MLEEMGFTPPQYVEGRASIADLFKPHERCGIYVLHFANGEFYAGQTVDVTRRYIAHRNSHDDIAKISFKAIEKSQLDDEERAVIWQLEQSGWSLRNITFTSIPKGESDFDMIMLPQDQERWLHDSSFVDGSGTRLVDPDLRRKYHNRYKRFLQMPQADKVIDVLKTYARFGIPAIQRGEVSFWCVSCLPKNDVYSRINIYWQEVLTVFTSENKLWFSFHLADSPFERLSNGALNLLFERYPQVGTFDHQYKPGGVDQIAIEVPSTVAQAFITDPDVLPSIRLFNLRLMKKGPCNFGRYHCMDLADKLIPGE